MVAVYGFSCSVMPATFMEALASCIVVNDANEEFLNVICYTDAGCREYTPAITCADNTGAVDPEAFVVSHAFGFDSCGNLALKLRICTQEEQPT